MPTVTRAENRQARRLARARAREAADRLTAREIEFLQALVDEGSVKLAAHAQRVREQTLKNALANMRAKVGVESNEQLTLVCSHRLRMPTGTVPTYP